MSKKHSPRFLALVESVRASVPEVSAEQVQAWFQANERFTLIDVREQDEWNAGHIEGAVHLSKGILERDIERAIPDTDETVVLYCGGGYRSALAAAALDAMGYTRAVSMAGGWRAWMALGGPVETP
jgi:rhodanese-related sulfurtransferase